VTLTASAGRASLTRRLTRGLIAAVVPGVLSAAITRALMSGIAWATNQEPSFDPASSLIIVAIYVVFLLPGCLALAFTRSWWSRALFAAGCGVILFEAVVIGLQETSAAQNLTSGQWLILGVMLLGMASIYGAQFLVAARWAAGQPAASMRVPGSGRGVTGARVSLQQAAGTGPRRRSG
jgi:hypothetical protein